LELLLELFSPIRGLDLATSKLQTAVETAFKKLVHLFPILDGVLLEDVTLDTTQRSFEHGLARKPRGYIVLRRTTGAVVFDDVEPTDRHIFFKASVTTTCTLWVF
jgi:hypothetical protein